MTRYVQYTTADGGTVTIEIEDEAGTEASQGGVVKAGLSDKAQEAIIKVETTFENAVDAVRRNAQAIIDKVKALSDPPEEVEVTFGLKATGDVGNLAIAKVGTEASYTVRLVWKRESKGKRSSRPARFTSHRR